MLFMIVGYLKPGAEEQLINFHDEFNEHFGQHYRTLAAAGVLRDEAGKRSGYMAFIEAESIEEAKRFRDQSPFYREHLYDRSEVLQYDLQVGQLG
jgi:uncharacterized protein YciI